MFKVVIEQIPGGKVSVSSSDCSAEDVFMDCIPALLSTALRDMPVGIPKENAKQLSVMRKLLLNGLAEVFNERIINGKTEAAKNDTTAGE